MKVIDSKVAPRTCVICEEVYKPTGYKQQACSKCTVPFRERKMPGWKSAFKATNPEYNKEYQREYYKRFPENYILWGIKHRCDKTGLPFNLTKEDIVIPDKCPVFGIPLYRNSGKSSASSNSPSVDRIIPALGYIKGNVQIISMKANLMKGNATIEELKQFANWVLKEYG